MSFGFSCSRAAGECRPVSVAGTKWKPDTGAVAERAAAEVVAVDTNLWLLQAGACPSPSFRTLDPQGRSVAGFHHRAQDRAAHPEWKAADLNESCHPYSAGGQP